MASTSPSELPIIQKTYDLILWYVPILNRLPRAHKFTLGDRMVTGLYELLEGLVTARYQRNKQEILTPLMSRIDLLKYQTRLLFDFDLVDLRRYEYASRSIGEVGQQLRGWMKKAAVATP